MTKTEQTFTTTAYGLDLSGTATWSGWTADERTAEILNNLPAAKAQRARLRCMRAAQKAQDAMYCEA